MTNNQIKELKEIVDKNLMIRGINVETKLEFDEAKKRFILTSTEFQTFPVIHFGLNISNFGGEVYQNKEREDILNIWLPVHVSYDGNGVEIFSIQASISKEESGVFGVMVKHATR